MTTRLYLVRHGATSLSAENRFAGSTGLDFKSRLRERQTFTIGELIEHTPDPCARVRVR